MFKALREQYVANQEQQRQIAREKWEQEKRWQQEDRDAALAAIATNAVGLDEHNTALKLATGVSYLTLVCHEDTWTFVATHAFGWWKPTWTKSTFDSTDYHGPNTASIYAKGFTVNPNLSSGRIKKSENGMQTVTLSGHNLVRILETLRSGTAGPDLVSSARCRSLYSKFATFVAMVDPEAPAGQTTGVRFLIDDSVIAEPASA
ncbi:hypothetical protein [Streptacidiphilus anmyonensis]|uniref:hypothetical protein n=1 Tax=Streptacidiphilus anmyonensis TaxID=405782 RepID=UPI0007C6CDC6|nr:hypothetical protein [Streptacidiphilus anmyonensis]